MILAEGIQPGIKSYTKYQSGRGIRHCPIDGQSPVYQAASPFDPAGSPVVVSTRLRLPSARTENALMV